jgi:hypothetical protein
VRTDSTDFSDNLANPPAWLREPAIGLPAWLLSVILHATVFIAFGLMAPVSRGPAPGEPEQVVGIAIVTRTPANTTGYLTESDVAGSPGASSAMANSVPEVGLPSLENFNVATGIRLPKAGNGRSAAGESIGISNAGELVGGGGGHGAPGKVGQTRTQVFGASGEGAFVYVFDRSSSMGGFDGRPLAAAKSELRKSLNDLASGNQFQIVFYNEQPTIFNPLRPNPPKMFFATEQYKQAAREYIQSMTPVGGTGHVEALTYALRMAPDVIFFLTDAGEPQLTARELADLQRKNRSSSIIHTIEFGAGPFQGGENFLIKLARQNRGQHVYVDVTGLPEGM